jgi:hypothetical protein
MQDVVVRPAGTAYAKRHARANRAIRSSLSAAPEQCLTHLGQKKQISHNLLFLKEFDLICCEPDVIRVTVRKRPARPATPPRSARALSLLQDL